MRTSFALQPELQFKFFLAEQLGKFAEEIDRMSCVEYARWAIYFERKAAAEQAAIEDARRGSRQR